MTPGSLTPDTRTKSHDLQTGLVFGQNRSPRDKITSEPQQCRDGDFSASADVAHKGPDGTPRVRCSSQTAKSSSSSSKMNQEQFLCRYMLVHFFQVMVAKNVWYKRFVLVSSQQESCSTASLLCLWILILVLHIPSQHFLQLCVSHRRNPLLFVL